MQFKGVAKHLQFLIRTLNESCRRGYVCSRDINLISEINFSKVVNEKITTHVEDELVVFHFAKGEKPDVDIFYNTRWICTHSFPFWAWGSTHLHILRLPKGQPVIAMDKYSLGSNTQHSTFEYIQDTRKWKHSMERPYEGEEKQVEKDVVDRIYECWYTQTEVTAESLFFTSYVYLFNGKPSPTVVFKPKDFIHFRTEDYECFFVLVENDYDYLADKKQSEFHREFRLKDNVLHNMEEIRTTETNYYGGTCHVYEWQVELPTEESVANFHGRLNKCDNRAVRRLLNRYSE